jgi:hypothetical protein
MQLWLFFNLFLACKHINLPMCISLKLTVYIFLNNDEKREQQTDLNVDRSIVLRRQFQQFPWKPQILQFPFNLKFAVHAKYIVRNKQIRMKNAVVWNVA